MAVVLSLVPSLSAQSPDEPVYPLPAERSPLAVSEKISEASTPDGFSDEAPNFDPNWFPAEGTARVIVVTGNAAAELNPRNPSAAVGQAASFQQPIRSQAQALGGRIYGSTEVVLNAVFVEINVRNIPALAQTAGVIGVYPDLIMEREDTSSTPTIGADDAWTPGFLGSGGYIGEGQLIAIIDSGIDYTHTHFGGPGNYSAAGNTTTLDSPGLFPAAPLGGVRAGFRGPKVVGGYDYVGDNYDASGDFGSTVPAPDPDPVDCPVNFGGGHGSHVAGSAAGYGVTNVGATYTGGYDSSIFPSYPNWTSSFSIGPGVAPGSALLAMRVFGCNGSTDTSIIINAMDDAVAGTYANGVQADVINMSLGSSYGSGNIATPYAIAVENAVNAGTSVVISAGNSSDYFFVTGAPSTTPYSISVANVTDTVVPANAIRNEGNNNLYPAQYAGFGPTFHTPITQTAVYANPATGCMANPNTDPLTNAAEIAGNIAIIDRGGCNFTDKANAAFLSGAVGLVVMNHAAGGDTLVSMGDFGGLLPAYDLPSTFIGYNNGLELKTFVDTTAAGNAAVTLDPSLQLFTPGVPDVPSSSTSRGSVRGTSDAMKPDIAAPGSSITSAGSGSGTQPYTISGTSMAAPHIAGAMALMQERRGASWTALEMKAAMMNTATANVTNAAGTLFYPPQRVGTGRAVVPDALLTDVIAYSTSNPAAVNVSFDFPEVIAGTTLNMTRQITLENKGSASQTYNVGYTSRTDMAGVAFSVSPSSVTVPAGGTANVTVTLSGNPNVAGVNANTDPTLNLAGPRHYLTEEAGLITFTGGQTDLRVAVYAAPRVASAMEGLAPLPVAGATGLGYIELVGTGVDTGAAGYSGAADILSQVTAFELVAEDAEDAGVAPNADIQYVGVATDIYADPADDLNFFGIYFGISTYGDWNTPNEVFHAVYMDMDQNGDAEYVLVAYRPDANQDLFTTAIIDIDGAMPFGGGPGALYTFGTFGALNYYTADVLNTYLFNTNMLVMYFDLYFLSLFNDDASLTFDFWVEGDSYDSDAVDVVDNGGANFTYDPLNPVYGFSDATGAVGGPYPGSPIWNDLDGFSIPVDYDFTGLTEPYPGILLFHHHNVEGTRTQVLQFGTYANLAATKTAAVPQQPPLPGDTITYTITVNNAGPASVDDMIVSDQLPAEVTYVSDTCPGVYTQGVPGSTPEICDLTGILLPAGGSLSFDITVTVNGGISGPRPVTNRATVSSAMAADPVSADDTGESVLCINGGCVGIPGAPGTGASNPYMFKSASPTAADIGDTVTYTIVYSNPSGVTLDNVVITDTFDSRLDNVTVISNTLGSAVVSGNTVTVQGFSLAPGQSGTLVVSATISARAQVGDIIANTATQESTSGSLQVSNSVTTVIFPDALPATGESQRNPLMLLLPALLLMLVGSMWFAYRRREAGETA